MAFAAPWHLKQCRWRNGCATSRCPFVAAPSFGGPAAMVPASTIARKPSILSPRSIADFPLCSRLKPPHLAGFLPRCLPPGPLFLERRSPCDPAALGVAFRSRRTHDTTACLVGGGARF